MEIVLYYAPNTCALAPYITLTEAGAAFEARPLNFGKAQNKSPDFMKLNPKHKVPLLVADGRTLTESTAIQMWILARPEGNLAGFLLLSSLGRSFPEHQGNRNNPQADKGICHLNPF
jgi:glutathione S-transferase